MDDQTRAKFIDWLKSEITSNEAIIGQMKKVGFAPDVLIKRKNTEMMACKIVLSIIESTESQTIF